MFTCTPIPIQLSERTEKIRKQTRLQYGNIIQLVTMRPDGKTLTDLDITCVNRT